MRKMKKSRARRLYYCLLKHYCCCFQMHCDSGNIRISIVLSPPRCLCLVLRQIRNILRIYIYRRIYNIRSFYFVCVDIFPCNQKSFLFISILTKASVLLRLHEDKFCKKLYIYMTSLTFGQSTC